MGPVELVNGEDATEFGSTGTTSEIPRISFPSFQSNQCLGILNGTEAVFDGVFEQGFELCARCAEPDAMQ